jgi:hypothetical protein
MRESTLDRSSSQEAAVETEDPWDEDGDDELEAEIMRADRPFGAELRGTTEEEALAGESIEEELAQERPEMPPTDEAVGLVDDGIPDIEGQLVSDGTLEEDDIASPEEAALSIRDEAPALRITTTLIRWMMLETVALLRGVDDRVHRSLPRADHGLVGNLTDEFSMRLRTF